MDLYMENREHGRMILESVKNGPLIWPTIEENGVIRTKKYAELYATEKIQADFDVKATNIILQGLPSDIYALVNHHRVAKDLWESVQLLMQDVLSEVPHSDTTDNDMLNQSDTNTSTQQDGMILSVFGKLSHSVTNCNKANKDNLIANESLSSKLEIYKERVKLLEETQNVDLSTREKLIIDDFEKEINSIKLTLSEQLKEKEVLTTTFNVLKNESKKKEAKYIDKEIALEKKVKELENIVYKMGQSVQTVHMLMKPQVFYDNNLKQALGFQNPFYLKKAQQIRPMLYDDFGKRFVPQQELSVKQAFWFQMSNPTTESFDESHVKVDVPSELPKVCLVRGSLKKLKFHLAQFDSVVKKRITSDAITEETNSALAFCLTLFLQVVFCPELRFVKHCVLLKDRPPMLATGRYPQWRSRFLRYIDTRPNGEALRKCILSGPYKPTTIFVQAVEAIDDSPAIPKHTKVETPMNMLQQGESLNIQDVKTNLFWEFGKFTSHDGETMEYYYTRFYKLMNEMIRNNLTVTMMQVNVQFLQQLQPEWSRFMTIVKQQHKLDEVSYNKLIDILKQYQNEVNELRIKRLARNANPLALVATAQANQDPYYQTSWSHKSHASSLKPSILTKSHTTTRHKGKEIAKPITHPSETASKEDNDPEQA
uniref:Integrase, catalytic region, zinc finger, CCHC-type, peptidase aspartic, catalytic n=1 Tax=Tanacetum cinerariifolium TaxID=118510 RepID=A0A6L2K0X4_TANCI|nr:hypothetical protein [Tanacetum cinerariifolium]GEU42996.1 hypothetical protein [Tanacetum cinerariifolium]